MGNTAKKFIIGQDLLEKTLNALATRPYHEVSVLIQEIQGGLTEFKDADEEARG